ncbi:MAG: peptide deformylase [Planctomycetota bacterium]|nr:peptide deformylase [Planctomycetota bacterium]
MSVDPVGLQIVMYPHPVLRKRASPVGPVTDEVRAVARRMIELMNEAEGIGLAAPQVGLSWRLFVVDVPHSDKPEDGHSLTSEPISATRGPEVYIDPAFSDPERDLVPFEEGCLSLPEIRGEVRRPSRITVTATNLEGQRVSVRGGGLLARCWQHEMDHLDGTLILDRMMQIDRMKNRQAIKELEDRGRRSG